MAESTTFDWNYPNLDRRRFLALANLLALRNGGQVEQSLLYDPTLDEEISTDQDETESVDTSRPGQISYSGQSRLKRRFLDGLAELFANEKGGRAVACTSMTENEEQVTVWVTRNEGFCDAETATCERLSSLLERMAKDSADQLAVAELWETMLIFYSGRLESSCIPEVRRDLKECRDMVFSTLNETEFTNALQQLTELFQLIFHEPSTNRLVSERHDRLVSKAYEVANTRAVRKLLWNSAYTTSKTKKLWKSVYFLSRVRIILDIFKEAVLTFPSFQGVTIILVSHNDWKRQTPQSNPLSLGRSIQLLGTTLKTDTIRDVLGSKWSINRAQGKFAALQKEKPRIHAEVQMVLGLLERDNLFHNLYPYFGCSKKSCAMCWHFLQALGTIQTRGCHGRLFKPWSVPQTSRLAPGGGDTIAKALISVQSTLTEMLKGEWEKSMAHERTSVVGGTSIFSSQSTKDKESKKKKHDIEQLRMKSEHARVAAMFERLSMEEAESTASNKRNSYRDDPNYVDECYVCGTSTARRCSVCNKDLYCSEACEEKRDGPHLFSCAKRPLTSADYLWRDIMNDTLPTDESILSDFRFDRFPSFRDQTELFGLYIGVMKYHGISAEVLHRWQVEGSLVANIKQVFFQVPESSRGDYFTWFLEHTETFDRPIQKEAEPENVVSAWHDKARLYLDLQEDLVRELKDWQRQPRAKREAYNFFLMALHSAHPHPGQIEWLNFGFCTCHDEREEGALGELFSRLLFGYEPYLYKYIPNLARRPKPTFTEFWKAYEAGKLIQLMDAKGYRDDRLRFPFLEQFLSVGPSRPRPSVWDLKQFIEINDPVNSKLTPAAHADYGFFNCHDFEEECILLEIYKRLLLKADPLALHAACLTGELFIFAQRFHRMEESHRRLMKNLYPLPGNPDYSGMSWQANTIIHLG